MQAVFLDRDGTMGGEGHFCHPQSFLPYPFTLEAIRLLKDAGLKVFAFTNQHRISRGEVGALDFQQEFEAMGLHGGYICPHPIRGGCQCQKPSPEMLFLAAREQGLDLKQCVVVGDVGSDMVAAARAGCRRILVLTGWGQGSLGEYGQQWADVEPDFVAQNLLDAAHWILRSR